jgi:hypothetical protein
MKGTDQSESVLGINTCYHCTDPLELAQRINTQSNSTDHSAQMQAKIWAQILIIIEPLHNRPKQPCQQAAVWFP